MFIVRYLFDEENHIIKEKKYKIFKSAYTFAKSKSIDSSSVIYLDGKCVIEFEFGEETFNVYKEEKIKETKVKDEINLIVTEKIMDRLGGVKCFVGSISYLEALELVIHYATNDENFRKLKKYYEKEFSSTVEQLE